MKALTSDIRTFSDSDSDSDDDESQSGESEQWNDSRRTSVKTSSLDDDNSNGNASDDDDDDDDDDEGDDYSEEDYDSHTPNKEDNNDLGSANEQTLTLGERLARQKDKQVDVGLLRERKARVRKLLNDRQMQQKSRNDTIPTTDDQIVDTKTKKPSKHAPTEASSKRSDFYRNHKRALDLNENGIGINIGAHRYKPRDPRMTSLNGYLDEGTFEKRFDFLQDIRSKEIETLKLQIAAIKTVGKKGQDKRKKLGVSINDQHKLEKQLKTMLQEKSDYDRRQLDRIAKQNVRKRLKVNVEEGKNGIYFPKRKELKRMELEEKFDEMRKRIGGDKAVDKAVAKRRKKNKSRDATLLPRK